METKKSKNRFSLGLLVLPALVLIGLATNYNMPNNDVSGSNYHKIDRIIGNTLPFSDRLSEAGTAIRYKTGESLQNGIFVSEQALQKELTIADDSVLAYNNKQIAEMNRVLSDSGAQIYFSLMPSSAGVNTNKLPKFSSTINQKNVIDNTYNQFAGELATIDVYTNLYENKAKYLYFRTEDQLTPLGGYYVYAEMVRRMLLSGEVIPITDYSVRYGVQDYYGKLYKTTPYKKVAPDLLSYYYIENGRKYSVSYINPENPETYNSFYSKKNGMESYLNYASGHIEIDNDSNTGINLLVIGDRSASMYLPFLSEHYDDVTFVNINSYSEFEEASMATTLETVDQVLIAIDIENYLNQKIVIENNAGGK